MIETAPWSPTELRDVAWLVELATPLEAEANRLGIFNVFDDGGYRTLLLLEMLGLHKASAGRMGDDARDDQGHTFELKTVNLVSTKGETKRSYPGVTTEHTLRAENLRRYRATHAWLVGVFLGNRPLDVYVVPTAALEPFFRKWDLAVAKAGNHEINNPKIPFGLIATAGKRIVMSGTELIERPTAGRFTMPETGTSKTSRKKPKNTRVKSRPRTGSRRTK